MRIFLSYASEQKSIAESIAFSLRGRGHHVFFDKDDLPASASYDVQIERAIDSSDFLIFLVSPESVATGRYTLTELEHARRRWRHPAQRVLPVMIAPTPLGLVPNFLKAVTILEPVGNLTAEVSAAVHQMKRSRWPAWQQAWQAGGLAILTFFSVGTAAMLISSITLGPEGANAPAANFLLGVVIFSLPLAAVIAVYSPSASWKALALFFSVIPAMTPLTYDSVVLQELAGINASSPAAVKCLYTAFFIFLVAALITALALPAASFATPEFRSARRWIITILISAGSTALAAAPFGEVAVTSEANTAAQQGAAALVICVWLAVTGGAFGYWIAKGDPMDAAAADALKSNA